MLEAKVCRCCLEWTLAKKLLRTFHAIINNYIMFIPSLDYALFIGYAKCEVFIITKFTIEMMSLKTWYFYKKSSSFRNGNQCGEALRRTSHSTRSFFNHNCEGVLNKMMHCLHRYIWGRILHYLGQQLFSFHINEFNASFFHGMLEIEKQLTCMT